MNRHITIGQVMTTSSHTIELTASISEARRLMYDKSIRHLPVMDQGGLYGILSDRDVKLACAVRSAETELTVADACVPAPYTFSETTLLLEVLQKMAAKRIGSVLVVKNGKLSGLFTTTDACRYFAQFLENGSGPADKDNENGCSRQRSKNC